MTPDFPANNWHVRAVALIDPSTYSAEVVTPAGSVHELTFDVETTRELTIIHCPALETLTLALNDGNAKRDIYQLITNMHHLNSTPDRLRHQRPFPMFCPHTHHQPRVSNRLRRVLAAVTTAWR